MTIENQTYGGSWQTCRRCGVKDRADQLEVHKPDGVHLVTHERQHIPARASKCAEWKATLALAKQADLAQAAQRKRR